MVFEVQPFMSHMIKLPKKFVATLLQWPKDGMGYQLVDVELTDGRTFEHQVVIDASFWRTDELIKPEIIVGLKRSSSPNKSATA